MSSFTLSERPLVSVCVPTYNAACYIQQTLESILSSTYPHLEVIVSDDASTDNTPALVESINDSRIRLFRNEYNLGPVRNWNRALTEAQGELLSLLNHDDLYGPFWLSFAVHALQKYPQVAWVVSSFRIINHRGSTLTVRSLFDETRQYDPEESFIKVASLDGLGPGFVARREVVETIGYRNTAGPGADNELFLHLASRYPLYYSNFPHNAWRWHSTNLTHQWTALNQVEEGLETLHQVTSAPDFPESLRPLVKPCFVNFYGKVLSDIQQFLDAGNIDSAQKFITLLSIKGYQLSDTDHGKP